MKRFILFICFGLFIILAYCQSKGMHIEWDSSSRHFVNEGSYARVKKLINGDLCLVYGYGPDIWLRKSIDGGKNWQTAIKVSSDERYIYTNSELLQLQNGWLLYMWNARPKKENLYEYKIMAAISRDEGDSWEEEQVLYAAEKIFCDGCWEPAALQLPSGEIQVYFANEGPYTQSSEQEITLLRSYDNCESWSVPQTVSFRAGSRDGMPVPLMLQNGSGIVMAIEDNGIAGRFKPVIIRTNDNWHSGVVDAGSPYRTHALDERCQLPDSIYAGAPYIIQLTNGATMLSVQSTEGRCGTNEKFANMQVYIGDDNACNFADPSAPFPTLEPHAQALWSSLCQIDENTVMAVSSLGGMKKDNGIWIVTGKIVID